MELRVFTSSSILLVHFLIIWAIIKTSVPAGDEEKNITAELAETAEVFHNRKYRRVSI
jgi:hypothetical protein